MNGDNYLLKSQGDGNGTPISKNLPEKSAHEIKVSHCQEMMIFSMFHEGKFKKYMIDPDTNLDNF